MAFWVMFWMTFFGYWCGWTAHLMLSKWLARRANTMQPLDRQQDAALVTDEPPGSAAGNPDGGSLEAFEKWCERELELHSGIADIGGYVANVVLATHLVTTVEQIRRYKRQGAA